MDEGDKGKVHREVAERREKGNDRGKDRRNGQRKGQGENIVKGTQRNDRGK